MGSLLNRRLPLSRWGLGLLAGQVFLGLMAVPARTQGTDGPKVDKAHLISYLRYAEGWTESVEGVVDDPKPCPIPGFSEVDVHLRFPRGKLDRVYYLSADGKSLVSGNLYDLGDSPFKLSLVKLKPGNAPAKGPADAPVTIVVFGDFQCPYCKDESKLLTEEIPKKYPKEVRVVFKDFPLEIHTWARKAAVAAHCVSEQSADSYWAFHETMYAHQGEIKDDNLEARIQEFAAQQKLDALRLNTCIQTKATAEIVEASEAEGRALGISQTPTMFINGRMVMGAIPLEKLEMVIQWELKRGANSLKTADEKCCEVNPPTVIKH
jgi:protein-disulfide isomerase